MNNNKLFQRRKSRVRTKLRATSDRPRLCIHRTNQHIYAQIISDKDHNTVVSASTLDADLKGKVKGSNKISAAEVGKLIAERAKKAKIETVVFDRGGFIYHGKIKALADAARESGLKF
jgi:large subunit ribosomal protein L18